MNKFFEVIGGILLIALFVVLVGVVIKNNVPAVNDWVNGWGQQQEQVTPTPETPTEDEQEPVEPETPTEDENGDEEPEVTTTTIKFGNNLVNIYVAA